MFRMIECIKFLSKIIHQNLGKRISLNECLHSLAKSIEWLKTKNYFQNYLHFKKYFEINYLPKNLFHLDFWHFINQYSKKISLNEDKQIELRESLYQLCREKIYDNLLLDDFYIEYKLLNGAVTLERVLLESFFDYYYPGIAFAGIRHLLLYPYKQPIYDYLNNELYDGRAILSTRTFTVDEYYISKKLNFCDYDIEQYIFDKNSKQNKLYREEEKRIILLFFQECFKVNPNVSILLLNKEIGESLDYFKEIDNIKYIEKPIDGFLWNAGKSRVISRFIKT